MPMNEETLFAEAHFTARLPHPGAPPGHAKEGKP